MRVRYLGIDDDTLWSIITNEIPELLSSLEKLSGDRNPYPGDLGVIKEGAYADILLVDGNPLDDIKVIGVLDNLRIIIKDGKVYKNTL
jgi:hypothetical protein